MPSSERPLRASFVHAVRASNSTIEALALSAGFTRTQLSTIISSGQARYTTLVIERLHKIAELIAYQGEVFRG